MAEKKFERRTTLDPAVADLLSGMQQRQAESQLPRKERERMSRERAKIQSRRDQRATYDLPPTLREEIMALSEELRIPASQLVTLALGRFLNDYHSGIIDLGKYKQPSRSPRYDWNLIFPDELIRIKKKKG
ncbi:MAG: hypothetical protein CVU42_01755 [Chloroflexi bacterium HGW-Chloroflexi-4]|jgi:hypothetical protein|nr:MAG: hypothetical protein CVU42_01755 [Chloroflexi bacterium HGW-Chloroflexi-4]